jgi:hypothetical protein
MPHTLGSAMHLQLPNSRVPEHGRKRQGLSNTDVAPPQRAPCIGEIAICVVRVSRDCNGGVCSLLSALFRWFEIPIRYQQRRHVVCFPVDICCFQENLVNSTE